MLKVAKNVGKEVKQFVSLDMNLLKDPIISKIMPKFKQTILHTVSDSTQVTFE